MLSGCHSEEHAELGELLGKHSDIEGAAPGLMDDCEIVNDVDDATHIVLGKENRRTIKVLLGIASGRHI